MKEIELPFDFNASDSDLEEYHISIPKGFEAEINKDNVVLKKIKNEDDNIRQKLIKLIKMSNEVGGFALHKWEADEILDWLEKQDKHHIACSEEQIKVLDEVLNFAANHESPYWNNYIFETLNDFIRQLKKTENIAGNLNDKDEKIRKALINVFATHKDYEMFFGVSVEDICAWLEKKAKQKPTTWNENDDYNLESCVLAILHSDLYVSDDKRKLEDWLNSIKNRIN